jgi:hypothetical protein
VSPDDRRLPHRLTSSLTGRACEEFGSKPASPGSSESCPHDQLEDRLNLYLPDGYSGREKLILIGAKAGPESQESGRHRVPYAYDSLVDHDHRRWQLMRRR